MSKIYVIHENDAWLEPLRAAFEIIDEFRHPIVERSQRFIAANGIEVAGIEFIADGAGELYTYDDGRRRRERRAARRWRSRTRCYSS